MPEPNGLTAREFKQAVKITSVKMKLIIKAVETKENIEVVAILRT